MSNELWRRRWIIRGRLEGWTAKVLGICEKTVDRWWSVYRKQGWEGLVHKSRKTQNYWKTLKETAGLVLRLRREKRWGPCKIEGYLRNYGREVVIPVGHNTIHRILI